MLSEDPPGFPKSYTTTSFVAELPLLMFSEVQEAWQSVRQLDYTLLELPQLIAVAREEDLREGGKVC